jgi:hypothetical protein
MIKVDREKTIFLLGLVMVLQVIIFAPQVGTGFVTDDFIWLDNIVINGEVDYWRPFTITTGLFRPLVSWTFGLQYELHGMNPRPFGWFNLFLHLVNILLVYLLLSSVEISRPYAFWAAALFGFNIKGTTMAVGWISGRTSLMFASFMLLSLYLYLKVRQHRQQGWGCKKIFLYFLVGSAYFAALLSKETAVVLPIFVFLASFISGGTCKNGERTNNKKFCGVQWRFFKKAPGRRRHSAFLDTVVFLIPLILYSFLRLNSNAFAPFNAPAVYRFTFTPLVVLKNLCEYITRAGMLDIIIIASLLIVLLLTPGKEKAVKDISPLILIAGTGWFLCFILPTLFIPTRSDIYIYVPQVGLHLVALPFIFYTWKRIRLSRRKKLKQGIAFLLVGISILVWMASFVYIASVYGEKGKSSTAFARQVFQGNWKLEPGTHAVIIDMEPGRVFSPGRVVSYGFAALLHLYYPDRYLTGEIILPGKATEIKWDSNRLVFFSWGKGRLRGPVSGKELVTMIGFIYPYPYPYPGFLSRSGEEVKPEKPGNKRLYRLKNRKLRLKQQNIEKK